MVFGSIVEIDDERGNVAKPLTHGLPPLGDAVGQTVAGDFGHDTVEKDLIKARQQETHGCQSRLRLEVVIRGLCLDSTFATARKGTDFDRCFGIDGDPEDLVSGISRTIDLTQVIENGIGLWNFFWGLLLATFLGK